MLFVQICYLFKYVIIYCIYLAVNTPQNSSVNRGAHSASKSTTNVRCKEKHSTFISIQTHNMQLNWNDSRVSCLRMKTGPMSDITNISNTTSTTTLKQKRKPAVCVEQSIHNSFEDELNATVNQNSDEYHDQLGKIYSYYIPVRVKVIAFTHLHWQLFFFCYICRELNYLGE